MFGSAIMLSHEIKIQGSATLPKGLHEYHPMVIAILQVSTRMVIYVAVAQ